jgi:2'-5' RNA ligase superfamily
MSLLVIGYPTVAEVDFRWMQQIRAQHDRLHYDVVTPHFTIVFPVVTIDQHVFLEHVKQRCHGWKKISFVLRCALIVKDAFNQYTHVFLVPDEGFSSIVRLHDALYTGPLASELRLDIPFLPHIGIGNALDPHMCKSLADQVNQKPVSIEGTIEALDVARHEGNKVKTIEHVALV